MVYSDRPDRNPHSRRYNYAQWPLHTNLIRKGADRRPVPHVLMPIGGAFVMVVAVGSQSDMHTQRGPRYFARTVHHRRRRDIHVRDPPPRHPPRPAISVVSLFHHIHAVPATLTS